MDLEKNQRGFKSGKFTDLYGEKCSIQKSSLATDDAIWLGIDKLSVSSRMHLNREQVAKLLPILQKFVETGELS